MPGSAWRAVEGERGGAQANLACSEEACEHRVDGRLGEGSDVRLEARPLARFHDAVVVGRSELAGEQKEGLVLQVGERDGVRVGQAVAFADLRGERLAAQDFGADAFHRLGMQGEPDVELPG